MKKSKFWIGFLVFLLSLYAVNGWADPWNPPEDLSFAPPAFLGESPPQIGVDKEGNAIAVWASQEPLGNVIKASRYDYKKSQWSFPKKIGGDSSEEPRLAVTSDGKAIVVWKKLVDGKKALFFNVFQNGWNSEAPIDIALQFHDDHPSIGVDESGHAMVVWQSQIGENKEREQSLASVIRSATYQFSTSSFGPIVNLSSDYSPIGQFYVGQPEVAVNASGKAVAVWRYQDGGATAKPSRIQCNTYQSGSWGREEDVAASSTVQLILPLAAISPKGDAMAVWLQTGLNDYVVAAATKTKQWGLVTLLSEPSYLAKPLHSDHGPYLAHAAFDHQGNAFVVWTYSDESLDVPYYQVQVKTFQKSSWSKTLTLSNTGIVFSSAKIAVDSMGNAWTVFASQGYSESSQPSNSILASRFIQEMNLWSLPEDLSTEWNNTLPNISTNANGNFYAIWVADKQNIGIIQSAVWNAISPPPPPPPPPPVIMPMPPRNVKGVQTKNDFATFSDRINTITWEAPHGGSAPAYYQIYRDSVKEHKEHLADIPAHEKLIYKDPHRKRGEAYTYYLLTVDGENKKSHAMKITVRPLN